MKNGDELINGRPSWAGKNLYELLKAPEVRADKTETIEEDFEEDFEEEEEVVKKPSDSPPPLQPVLTVQHCILEHDNQNPGKTSKILFQHKSLCVLPSVNVSKY